MKQIKVKQNVFVVVERWNIDYYDHEVSVYSTLDKAKEYMEKKARKIADIEIEDGVVRIEDYMAIVDDPDGGVSDWWEATIEKKEVE